MCPQISNFAPLDLVQGAGIEQWNSQAQVLSNPPLAHPQLERDTTRLQVSHTWTRVGRAPKSLSGFPMEGFYSIFIVFPCKNNYFFILFYSHSTIVKIRKWIVIKYKLSNHRSYSDFVNHPNNIYYGWRNPGSCVAFSGHVSLVSLNQKQFFVTSASLRSRGQLFCKMYLSLGLPVFLHN